MVTTRSAPSTERVPRSTRAPRRRLPWFPRWFAEVVLVAAIYLAYELLRGVHLHGSGFARTTGSRLLSWEHAVHIAPEMWLTQHLVTITWLAVPACYIYATAHYVVTPAVLAWLYVRHRYSYGRGRSWLAFSTLVSLLIFYLLPTAPPRLLGRGFPDVMARTADYGWWGSAGSAPKGLGHLTNQFAAMPSMHVGWALWCGVMVYRCAPYAWVRALGVLYPILTTMVVISTGNHYLLDAVGGLITMGLGALVTQNAYRLGNSIKARHARTRSDRDAGPRSSGRRDPQRQAQKSLHTTSG